MQPYQHPGESKHHQEVSIQNMEYLQLSTQTLLSCGQCFSLFYLPCSLQKGFIPRHPRRAALNHKPHQGTSLERWFGHFLPNPLLLQIISLLGQIPFQCSPTIPDSWTHFPRKDVWVCAGRYLFSPWEGGGYTETSLNSVLNQPPFLPSMFPRHVGTKLGNRVMVVYDVSKGNCPKPSPSAVLLIYYSNIYKLGR